MAHNYGLRPRTRVELTLTGPAVVEDRIQDEIRNIFDKEEYVTTFWNRLRPAKLRPIA
jgi:hypothetical protein